MKSDTNTSLTGRKFNLSYILGGLSLFSWWYKCPGEIMQFQTICGHQKWAGGNSLLQVQAIRGCIFMGN